MEGMNIFNIIILEGQSWDDVICQLARVEHVIGATYSELLIGAELHGVEFHWLLPTRLAINK